MRKWVGDVDGQGITIKKRHTKMEWGTQETVGLNWNWQYQYQLMILLVTFKVF